MIKLQPVFDGEKLLIAAVADCIYCGGVQFEIEKIKKKKFALKCRKCGARGPHSDSKSESVLKWNSAHDFP